MAIHRMRMRVPIIEAGCVAAKRLREKSRELSRRLSEEDAPTGDWPDPDAVFPLTMATRIAELPRLTTR